MILNITSLGKNPQGVGIMITHLEAGIPEEVLMIQGTGALSEDDPLLVIQNDQEGGPGLPRATQEIDPRPDVHMKDPVARPLVEGELLVLRDLDLLIVITTGDELVPHLMHSLECRRRLTS